MQIFINGIISGLTLALLALSFSVVYLPTRVFYIALAGVYTIVPFIAWALMQVGVSPYIAVAAAVATGSIISVLAEALNHAPLNKQGASGGIHMISSLAVYILITQICVIVWGADTKVLRSGVSNVLNIGGVIVTSEQIMALAVSLAVLFVFYFWLFLTKVGLEFRALADNQKEFALRGYNVASVRMIGFFVAGLLCSVSSLLSAYDIGFDPHGGLAALLLAVVAVIIGGKQSFGGPVIGAFLLAISRSEVTWYFSARWEQAITFALLAAFLFFRPQGLVAQSKRIEAEA